MNNVRILLVEDDEDDFIIVRDLLLQIGGARLDWVQDYDAALDRIARGGHDVYLFDFRLGEHDGLELLRRAGAMGCTVPIILLTGLGDYQTDMEAMKGGAVDYLIKGEITPALLERSIRYAIGRKQVERELKMYRDRLEELVSERTAQLEESNGRLRREIAERKKVEGALRESEEQYRKLVESTSDAIIMLDVQRNIVSCNQAFLDLFGYRREEVEGRSIRLLHPSEESYVTFGERVYPPVTGSRPMRIEWELMRRNGEIFPVEATYSAISAFDGSLKGFVAILRDVTERREAEEELRRHRDRLEEMVEERTRELEATQRMLIQKEKLKTLGVISAEVAHEIRNPLVAIGGFARRLQKKLPGSVEADIILSESQRLERLLGRIRNYLRAVENRPSDCPVNSIVAETVALLSPELERKRVSCRLDLKQGIAPAYVDPEVLAQVFINLIRNAMDEMSGNESLSIRTYECGKNVCVEFENPNPGGKFKDPELLFLPFDKGGSSIGLPLSYRMLKEMGGHLSFTQHDGRATFTVSLLRALEPGSRRERDELAV